jgi:hypothetical protein
MVMRHLVVLVSLLVVLTGVEAYAHGTAAAQDATATHPAIGAWRFESDLGGGNTFPSVAIFHTDEGTSVGTRMKILPIVPLAELLEGTPVQPPDLTTAGTRTP